KGADKMLKLTVILRARFRMDPVFSLSFLITFQGSVSARYLFPNRAKSITRDKASLNLNFSIEAAILSGNASRAAITSWSYWLKAPLGGTTPSKYLWVSTMARFTKFP